VDWNDWHVSYGLDALRVAIVEQLQAMAADDAAKAVPAPAGDAADADAEVHWNGLLLRDQYGYIKPIMGNIALILTYHPEFKGVLAYCEFSNQIKKLSNSGIGETGALDDEDTLKAKDWLTTHYRVSPKTQEIEEAMRLVARKSSFHPIREFLSKLVWDGEERLGRFLADVSESEQDPEYLRLASRKFFIGSVARIFKPGCKMDTMLILEGRQGKRKSSFIEMMYAPWSISSTFDIRSKEGFQFIQGLWAVEFAELDAMNRAESTAAKQFITSPVDRFRPPFGRLVKDYPRQCVFLGTTNDKQYLNDPTGNRRYWPLECPTVNFEYAQRVRDQVWAEAVVAFNAGEDWWVKAHEQPLFEAEQDRKTIDDLWQAPIEEYLRDSMIKDKPILSGAQILKGALGKDVGHGSKVDYKRISDVMKGLGWEKQKKRLIDTSNPVWVYVRPIKNNAPAEKNGGLNSVPSASVGLSAQEWQDFEEGI
jgi:putative DNA primase/helicase